MNYNRNQWKLSLVVIAHLKKFKTHKPLDFLTVLSWGHLLYGKMQLVLEIFPAFKLQGLKVEQITLNYSTFLFSALIPIGTICMLLGYHTPKVQMIPKRQFFGISFIDTLFRTFLWVFVEFQYILTNLGPIIQWKVVKMLSNFMIFVIFW